jgi:PLP dependent protein
MTIHKNLERVQAQIGEACTKVGRDPQAVTLVAVSKTHPASSVLEAAAAGTLHFGENRVEEAEVKIPLVKGQTTRQLKWHMVGHLQSRKAKDAAPLFDTIHSIDTLKLAEKLSRHATEFGRTIDVMLEINIAGEENKYGFPANNWEHDDEIRAALFAQAKQIRMLPNLQVVGLMTMAPIVAQMEEARPVFAGLARLRLALQMEIGAALPELSMGMTDDYPIAIEEGATIVRIGRAIFGERTRQD